MMIKLLFNKPHWFKHEGYWRLAQVLRLGTGGILTVIGAFALIASLSTHNTKEPILIGLTFLICAPISLILIDLILRLMHWLVDGFTVAKKSG